MTRRILAIAIAFVLSIAGHLLVYAGGIELMMRAAQFAGAASNPLAVVALIAGLLLVALAAATVAISSAGVIAVGVVHVLYGLLMVLVPFAPLDGLPSPAVQFTFLFMDINRAFTDGLTYAFSIGTGLLTGVVLIVAGVVARSRTMRANPVAILVSVGVSILGFIGIVVAISGGARIFMNMFVRMSGLDVLGIALLLLGTLLLAAAVVTVRWSSAGVIVLGAVTTIMSIVWAVLPTGPIGRIMGFAPEFANAMMRIAPSGLLAIVGVVLVGVGVGSSLRARRAAAASTVRAPGEPAPVV